jgi:predicted glycogen debranching enzyme
MHNQTDDWTVRLPWNMDPERKAALLVKHEWLVTNGLGGYASGTLAGVASRRYHSLLVAALPAPLGRQVMFNHLSELIRLPSGQTFLFGGEERPGRLDLRGVDYLQEFRLERGLPMWRYEVLGFAFEKRILLPYQQNTVHVNYRLLSGEGVVRLKLRPSVHFRHYEAPVSAPHPGPYQLTTVENRYELSCQSGLPPLRLFLHGERPAFTMDCSWMPDVLYRVEESRGYEAEGRLWSPGYFRVDLSRDHDATLVVSTEPWEAVLALCPDEAWAAERERRANLLALASPQAQGGLGRDLVMAADQFLITPAGRLEDAARARAAGEEARTVIAGYHWFTDWGRDTMISLEGLALTTGRHRDAGSLLRTFAHHVRDGLIPNLFPDGQREGLYHTADATLWYFHALDRYLTITGDVEMRRALLPKLLDIAEHHLRGTRFGIAVDPDDGLLRQGEAGYQLTWMDAKVGDWVVTPRRGKAVEINALWYNALRLLTDWVRAEQGEEAARIWAAHAHRAGESFNRRFWLAARGYLYDVVDGEQGDDDACRPNQVFAISLPHAVLDRRHWASVLEVVSDRLLTSFGLRTLAPDHPDYKPQYYGDLRSRDAAYHQGTVWPWLIGPFIDAWLKVHPQRRREARQLLAAFEEHLGRTCIGSINEIFDAEPPYAPRGCIAQAWSVAEVLRCWAKTAEVQTLP